MSPYRAGATPATVYADVDRASRVLGATPHGLVAILYDELLLALGVARRAVVRGDRTTFADRRDRALLLLGALDHGLDRGAPGGLADALSALYQRLGNALRGAGMADAELTLSRVAEAIAELADAWTTIARRP